jgi:hypothetical protein
MYARSVLITAPILLLCAISSCTGTNESADADGFPELTGPYLGQTPPGAEPALFAPGIVSTGMYERDVAFTPDGTELYFGVMTSPFTKIVCSRLENGRWTEPELPPFASDPSCNDFEPCISPDGERFLFLSTRPPAGQEPKPGWGHQNIWAMDRTESGWSEPYDLGFPINTDAGEYFPSLTDDGTLYFSRGTGAGESHIYRARYVDGGYAEPEKLGPRVNSQAVQYNAFVARDESYLIVCLPGREDNIGISDYYVCFRDTNDVWTEPINLGEKINAPGARASSPYVTPDGKYFFFSTTKTNLDPAETGRALTYDLIKRIQTDPQNGNGDIYWVDAAFIEALRPR